MFFDILATSDRPHYNLCLEILVKKISVLEPVSPVHFLFAPTVTFLGQHFFFFFFLALQAVSSELIFIHIQIISIVIIILAVITPASFLMEILLHWLALEQPSLDICSSLWHLIPDALSPGKINVGKIFYCHPNFFFKCAACPLCELHLPSAFLLHLELASSPVTATLKFWKCPLFILCVNWSWAAAPPQVQLVEESRSVDEVGMAHVVGMQPCGRCGIYAIKTECSGNCAATLQQTSSEHMQMVICRGL